MTTNQYLFWLGTILALTGAIFNAKGKRIGFILLNLSNIPTTVAAILTDQWYMVVMVNGFTLINFWGYFNWKKAKIGN